MAFATFATLHLLGTAVKFTKDTGNLHSFLDQHTYEEIVSDYQDHIVHLPIPIGTIHAFHETTRDIMELEVTGHFWIVAGQHQVNFLIVNSEPALTWKRLGIHVIRQLGPPAIAA